MFLIKILSLDAFKLHSVNIYIYINITNKEVARVFKQQEFSWSKIVYLLSDTFNTLILKYFVFIILILKCQPG